MRTLAAYFVCQEHALSCVPRERPQYRRGGDKRANSTFVRRLEFDARPEQPKGTSPTSLSSSPRTILS